MKDSVFRTPEEHPNFLLHKAVALLSRREYSATELRQKLRRYTDNEDWITSTMARLQKERWQSDERFLQHFVTMKQGRWGNQKLLHALKSHQLPEEALETVKTALAESEFERAYAVWHRKFKGEKPSDPKSRLRHLRFLASRGFSASVAQQVLAHTPQDSELEGSWDDEGDWALDQ